jgi:hypothetical protein
MWLDSEKHGNGVGGTGGGKGADDGDDVPSAEVAAEVDLDVAHVSIAENCCRG